MEHSMVLYDILVWLCYMLDTQIIAVLFQATLLFLLCFSKFSFPSPSEGILANRTPAVIQQIRVYFPKYKETSGLSLSHEINICLPDHESKPCLVSWFFKIIIIGSCVFRWITFTINSFNFLFVFTPVWEWFTILPPCFTHIYFPFPSNHQCWWCLNFGKLNSMAHIFKGVFTGFKS